MRRTDCHVRAAPFLAMTEKLVSAPKKNGQAPDICHCEEALRADVAIRPYGSHPCIISKTAQSE